MRIPFNNLRYNPFTQIFTPYGYGYSGNAKEVHTIPSSAPYWIHLNEIPKEDSPSTLFINEQGGSPFTEVSFTTSPAANQFRVTYGGDGTTTQTTAGQGIVEFNSADAGKVVEIKYYGLGNIVDSQFMENVSDKFIKYWTQTGNDLNIATTANPVIAALTSTRVAFIDSTNEDLRAYDFDGTDWVQVGNDLNIATVGFSVLAALSSARVAFIDSTNEDLRTYDFDGTDWVQVGNDLNIAGIGTPSLAALNSTRVAFIDSTNDDLRAYDFDGTDWTQTGNDSNISGAGNPALTALSGTRVAFIDNSNQYLRTYDFDGKYWTQIGNELNIAGIGTPSLTALSGKRIAFADSINDDLRTYDQIATFENVEDYPPSPAF